MQKNNSISSKNHNRYKKLKYKRTGQEVYNILKLPMATKMGVELDIANTNLITNINNQSDKKIKQLIKTLCCHFLTIHFKGVLTNCL